MTNCIRCGKAPAEVRSICVPCDQILSGMHTVSEYGLYNRTYYIPSQEGTSFEWLIKSQYKRDLVFSYIVGGTQIAQVSGSVIKELVNSS